MLLVSPAKADLTGSTLSWQYYAYGVPYTSATSSGTFTVSGGIGGTFSDGTITYFNIIATGTSIAFDYSVDTWHGSPAWAPSVLTLAPTIYNGIAINMVSGPAFTSVGIDPATNMAGFSTSNISFTGNQIQVDWQNLRFSPRTIVKLDVNSSPVPVPASLLLFGPGLVGLAAIRRKFKK
jgi:hypothetical protein